MHAHGHIHSDQLDWLLTCSTAFDNFEKGFTFQIEIKAIKPESEAREIVTGEQSGTKLNYTLHCLLCLAPLWGRREPPLSGSFI